MANTISYNAGRAGTATLQNPTLTVSRTAEISEYRSYTVLVRIVYTVRATVFAASAAELKVILEHYRTVLNVSGGIFLASYDNDADFMEAGPETDVTDGPHPTFLDIQQLHGGRSAIITWALMTEKHVKDDNVNAVGAWLDFTYTISTALDQNFYGTRTISGILRLSSCHSQTKYHSADAFRGTVEMSIAPVPATGLWQRVRRDYRLSADQRVLAFTIVDQQLYTLLPYGITSGDLLFTTTSERDGTGRFTIRGWFEADANTSRGFVQQFVKEIWEKFFNLVVQRIESETAGENEWKVLDERRSYTLSWRSNRVEFYAMYEVLGLWQQGVPDNIEYTVNRALDWLAYLSRYYNRSIVDRGPYGSAPVIGPDGLEIPGPLILIDPMEKLPAGFAYGPGAGQLSTPGDKSAVRSGTAKQLSYVYWHQNFEYKYDAGLVVIPVKAEDACDVVQQTKNITVYLQVTGEAARVGYAPEVPYYPHEKLASAAASDTITSGVPKLVLLNSEVTTREPDASDVYRLAWKQLYKFHNVGKYVPYKWPETPLNTELGDKELPRESIPSLPL